MAEKTKEQKAKSLIPMLNSAGLEDVSELLEKDAEKNIELLKSEILGPRSQMSGTKTSPRDKQFEFFLDVLNLEVEFQNNPPLSGWEDFKFTNLNLAVAERDLWQIQMSGVSQDSGRKGSLSLSTATKPEWRTPTPNPMSKTSPKAISKSELISFTKFFSTRYEGVKKLFDFFQRNLKQDLNDKKKKIEQNGIDFERDKILLGETIETLRDAIREALPSAVARGLEDKAIVDEKYQVTIVEDPARDTFKGVFLYFPGPTIETVTRLYRVWIDSKYFALEPTHSTITKTSQIDQVKEEIRELHNKVQEYGGWMKATEPDIQKKKELDEKVKELENTAETRKEQGRKQDIPWIDSFSREYIKDITSIAKLSKQDMAKAKNMMACHDSSRIGAATAWVTDKMGGISTSPLLDYIAFSKKYHKHKPIKESEMTAAELSEWRSKQVVDVGSKGNIITGAYKGIGESMMSIVSDSYTVQKGDTLLIPSPADVTFPFGKVKQPDGSMKPSKLGQIMSSYKPPTGKSTTEMILNLNGFSDERLLEIDKEKIAKWTKLSEEKGNALSVGETINLPRASSTRGANIFSKDTYKDVDFATDGRLTGEQLVKIWREEVVDKLLLKICPATAIEKLKECLLPSNCRELIKFIGLWRTRQMLEPFVIVDSFDARNGLLEALTQWDELVAEQYNFKAVHFSANGVLSSGEFDSKDIIDSNSFSLSFQIRIEPKDTKAVIQNAGGSKPYQTIMSIGEASSSGTISKGPISIKISKHNNLNFHLHSPDGTKMTYSTHGGAGFNITDNLWHQVGVSYDSATGKVTAVVDGRDVKAKKTSDDAFTGPVATPESARMVLASENWKQVQKPFAGHLDEIVVFNKVLEEEEWKTISKINSDSNLATMGMTTSAKAWWRMGDSLDDDLAGTSGKIVDKLGSQVELSLTKDGSNAANVVVARLFEDKDMDRFIDMISRNTSIVEVCDMLLESFSLEFDTGWDPDAIQEALAKKLAFPAFHKDPHSTTKIVIQTVLVENLIRMFAQFLWKMLEKIMDCKDWKAVLAGVTRGTLGGAMAADGVFADMIDQGPLGDFTRAVQNPDEWDRMWKEDFSRVERSWEDMLNKFAKVSQQSGDAKPTETTLGLGSVQFTDSLNRETDPNVTAGPRGSTISVEDISTTDSQNTMINIVKRVSQEMPPEDSLQLFSSNPTPDILARATAGINAAQSETGVILSESDVASLTGQIGSLLGLETAIDQLQYAAQVLNSRAPLPDDACAASSDTASRMGLPQSEADKAAAKEALEDLMNSLDDIKESAEDEDDCSIEVPLSAEEKSSLARTINDVYSPVLMAYDNDLTLYKLGMTSVTGAKKKVKKVLWKGDIENINEAGSDGVPKLTKKKIEETVINPEFETMVKQGFIPLKKDGKTIDGTKYGGVVKINWNPFNSDPWLSEKRPPESLVPAPPETEDDDVQQPDVEIGDLWTSLGPYTDYTEEYAIDLQPRIKLSGKAGNAFAENKKDFMLPGETEGAPQYFAERERVTSLRGMEKIDVDSRTTLISSPSPSISDKRVDVIRSDISLKIAYGRSLSGNKLFSFNQSIKRNNAASFTSQFPAENDFVAAVPFSVSQELRRALESFGYDETSEECSDVINSNVLFDDTNVPPLSAAESYTPQEHAFEKVANRNRPTGIPTSTLKSSTYDSLYREVLTALIYKTADSPLLKPVPGVTDSHGDSVLAMNFLNLNTSPRLLDMESFSTQVAEDYTSLMACPKGLVEPALYAALKTSLPRMLARMCVIELAVKGIIPFTQLFYSKKDAAVRGFIMEKLEKDLELFASDSDSVKTKIVAEYNKMATRGAIDSEPIETDRMGHVLSDGWKKAMGFFIEEEFDFVASRLKELIHGECIPESPGSEEDIKNAMYAAIFNYAELGDKPIKIETYAVMKPIGDEEPEVTTDFSVRTQYEDIESIGISMIYEYNGQSIVLSKMEEKMEDFLKDLPIDLTQEELECDWDAIYPRNGFTTKVDNHEHSYSIDENGNGITDEVHGHVHAIHQYAVVPAVDTDGNVTHSHSLVPRATQASIEENFSETMIMGLLKDKLSQTDSFKVMFDFCFKLEDISTLVLAYYLASIEDQIMAKTFTSSKKAIIDLFRLLWLDLDDPNSSKRDCLDEKSKSKGLSGSDMFPDMADAFLNPEFLLMMLIAPLNTYKGWSKIADPHVFITTTIMDLLRMPVIPKNVKKNIPDIDRPGEMKCADWPDFRQAISIADAAFVGGDNIWGFNGPYDMKSGFGSGVPIPDFAIENLVQVGVTFAPMVVGLPPYPATPFGYIYYFAVSPLIWILRDLPRLLEQLGIGTVQQGPPSDFARLLASTGLNVNGLEVTCDEDATGGKASESEEDDSAADEDCPPIRNFNQTELEVGSSADDC